MKDIQFVKTSARDTVIKVSGDKELKEIFDDSRRRLIEVKVRSGLNTQP